MRYGGGKNYKVDSKVIKAFMNYPWPGNVRELENVIERMVTLAADEKITMDDLPAFLTAGETVEEISGFSIQIPEKGVALDLIEKNVIEMVLNKVNGNQSEAARLLKIPRHVLLYRMKKFEMG
jgi:two-component system NtrC family response regulator